MTIVNVYNRDGGLTNTITCQVDLQQVGVGGGVFYGKVELATGCSESVLLACGDGRAMMGTRMDYKLERSVLRCKHCGTSGQEDKYHKGTCGNCGAPI